MKNKDTINYNLAKIFQEKYNEKNKIKNEESLPNNQNITLVNGYKSENISSNCNSCLSCSSCKSCSSCSFGKRYNKKGKSFIYKLPVKNILNSSNTNNSNIKKKEIVDKDYQIYKNKELKYNADYFNLNQITNGKFAKNINFQNYIKNIILEKISDLTHSNLELPRVKNRFKFFNLNGTSLTPKKIVSKKYSTTLPFHNYSTDKKMNTFLKHQRNNYSLSELKEIEEGNDCSKKQKGRKTNNHSNLLNYVNKNIKDDNTVLHEPGKFYSGLFNNIMKNYSNTNLNLFKNNINI